MTLKLIYGECEQIDIIQNCINDVYNKQHLFRCLKCCTCQITKSLTLFCKVMHLCTQIFDIYSQLKYLLVWSEKIIKFAQKCFPDLKSLGSNRVYKHQFNHSSITSIEAHYKNHQSLDEKSYEPSDNDITDIGDSEYEEDHTSGEEFSEDPLC